MQRFPPIAPEDLQGEQKQLHKDIVAFASKLFGDKFVWQSASGAVLGPFTPLLYVPAAVAQHFLGIAASVGEIPDFPATAREIAILTTGAHFGALYEIYAHERVAAETTDLTQAQIDAVKVGRKPEGLGEGGSVSYDVAMALCKGGGPLEDGLWRRAEGVFGRVGAQALVQYVGVYAYTCILLNGCACPLPEGEQIK